MKILLFLVWKSSFRQILLRHLRVVGSRKGLFEYVAVLGIFLVFVDLRNSYYVYPVMGNRTHNFIRYHRCVVSGLLNEVVLGNSANRIRNLGRRVGLDLVAAAVV